MSSTMNKSDKKMLYEQGIEYSNKQVYTPKFHRMRPLKNNQCISQKT